MSKSKAQTPVSNQRDDQATEHYGDLPEGWENARLSQLFELKYGKGLTKEVRDNCGATSVYGSNGIVGKHSQSITSGATIIIGRKGSAGEVHFSPTSCWPIDTTYFIDEFPASVPPVYWLYFLQSLKLGQQEKSSAIPGINREDIYGVILAIPPLAEQHRIVAKLEEVLGKVSSSQQRLARIPALLKRFRQSVLAAACSGKLTNDWRKENACDETGEILLSRIKASRLKNAASSKEKNQIESAFGSSILDVTSDELGFDTLPETWKPCRIGAVGTVSNGSTPSRQQSSFWDGDIPWVSSGEVRNNLITSTRERITQAGFDGTSVRLLPRGTVLIAMIGEGKTRGQSAILEIEATINQNIAAVVISHGLVEPAILWRWFQMRYEAIREQGAGSGPQALNCQRVRELPFVLPPLNEQKEIVRRVESLLAFADQVEARFRKAQSQVDQLTQSVLAKAFRGELVPTEAELAHRENRSYESASQLLARVQAERNAQSTIAQVKRKRVQSQH